MFPILRGRRQPDRPARSTRLGAIGRVPAGRIRILAMALLALRAAGAGAQEVRLYPGVPEPPPVNARSVVVMETAGGRILYERDADLPIPPASLTKLMTLRVLYKEFASGRMSPDDIVTILPEDCSLPYNSSLMYLQPYMRVPVRVLMQGLAVVSGNDAARALARAAAGSIEAFAARMNEEAALLGLETTRFVEPSGLSEYNLTTAREMALFALRYLKDNPESLRDLHSLRWIEFPTAEYMPPGVPPPKGRMVQYNNNKLIRSYEGADGLKTGFIRESGFNLVATAEREGTRFLIVTLGGSGSSSRVGGDVRERDGRELLDWAFRNFITVRPRVEGLPALRLWKTSERSMVPVPGSDPAFTVQVEDAPLVRARVEVPPELVGPIPGGRRVGRIAFEAEGRELHSVDLVSPAEYPLGSFWIRLRDGIALFFRGLFGKRPASV